MGQGCLMDGLVSPRLGRNARLERLAREVDWADLGALLSPLRAGRGGRPPFDALLMVKVLVLQRIYGLSDHGLEEALDDRVSFRRFVGLSLEDTPPDHSTICRFRNRLLEADLGEALFVAFERQLAARGLIVKQGTMIDASLVATPFRPGSRDGLRAPVDGDAANTARQGRSGGHFGYKLHIGVDHGSRLIRRVTLTPANVNDTVPADDLVCGDEKAVYADKAYAKHARRQWLRAQGIKPRIMHKSWGGAPPLTRWQQRHNALIAPIRAQVEGVFATLKRWRGFDCVRYKGLARNRNDSFLLALAYNMTTALRLT